MTGQPRTFWELLEQRVAASPDATMLIDEADRRLTFAAFRDHAEGVAAGLHALGVEEGTTVSWQLPTRIDTVVVSMALARLGAVQNPILHVYREREVGFALHQLEPRLAIVPGVWRDFDFEAMVRKLVTDMDEPPEILVTDPALPEGDPATLPPPPAGAPGGSAPVRWIYYTSGTTSDPKGVRHTDETLLAGGRGLALAMGMTGDDVGSIAFPFTHIAGPDYLVMMLENGFPSVLVEAFVPAEAVQFYRRHGVTMAGGSTAFYLAFLNEQRKQPDEPIMPLLRALSGGGAPKPPEVYFEVKREMGIPVIHGYGMTEVPMIAMGTPDDSDDQLAHTDGKPILDAEVRIVTLDGAVAGPDEDGEVRVRGPMVCRGYTDPALDADAFDDDGFFRTGDLGHLRADGHLVLTGRVKDIIIRKGENISAQEIESVLYTHAKVGDVAVVGLPDRERGERVCAVVETAPGAEPLTFDEMVDLCRGAGLMAQKIPEQLEVVDELPRNKTLNKVLKQKLRDQLAGVAWSGHER
ncbi:MAG TPA: AMP-binding protein [Acidimicrobiia bacterium]